MSTWTKTWYENSKKQNKYKACKVIIFAKKNGDEYLSIATKDEYDKLQAKIGELEELFNADGLTVDELEKQVSYLDSQIEEIVFDSGRESKRFCELLLLKQAGEIENLSRQVEYVLIPVQKSETRMERKCSYFADFVYTDKKTGKVVVEDTKGMKTKDYIIKRKLMLYIHNIEIQEI